MFSTTLEDVEIDSTELLEVEKGYEVLSMIPVYKNKDKHTIDVILRVKKEDINEFTRAKSKQMIPDLTKYKRQTRFGYGLPTYQRDIVEYYKDNPDYHFIILRIRSDNILNTTTLSGYKRLEEIYNEMKRRNLPCNTDYMWLLPTKLRSKR